jgi:acyl CoA:acetate/3-ketoacid CoA transferase beta subunit
MKNKVYESFHLPISGAPQHVDLVITDVALMDVKGPKGKKEGLVLKELAPGWTVDELRVITEARFEVSPDLKVYEL